MANKRFSSHRFSPRRLQAEQLESRCLFSVSPPTIPQDSPPSQNSGAPAEVFAAETDTVAPRVVGVKVSSSTWQPPFLNHVDSGSQTGFPIRSLNHQLTSLPWGSIDRIQIHVSENVGASFDKSRVVVHGINVADYAPQLSVTYDDTQHLATIQFAASLNADKNRIGILDTLTDLAGNRLDGEWLDGSSQQTSGNGVGGGNFAYRLNVLPGDLSGDGVVLGNDVTLAVLQRDKVTT